MLTIDDLRKYGANVDEGLQRCINNEGFYLKMVGKALGDDSVEKLSKAVKDKDYDTAFEVAHALKGVFGNLALTPMYAPLSEMVEHLRKREDMDYSGYMETIEEKLEELKKLL